jgi:hypothetical protein
MTKCYFRRFLPAALLVGLVALFAVACGGSQQTTTSSSAASGQTTTSLSVTSNVTSNQTTTSASAASTGTGKSGSIVFSGLIDYPMTFNALDMDYMDWSTVTAEDPELGSTKYEGVRLSDILNYVGVKPDAKVVVITGADGTAVQVTLADLSNDALLALADDNSLNTVMPGMASEAWVKDVVKMELK